MRYGSIYVITNQRTGEQYVGQTIKSVKTRWYAHCVSAQKPKFAVAHNIAMHGQEAFSIAEVFVAFDKKALDDAERQLIATLHPSLNRTSGGAGYPRVCTEEERLQRSLDAKRRWADPQWCEKTLASIRAAGKSEAARARGMALQAYKGGAIRWAGHVKAVPEAKDKSESIRKSWQDPEVRKRRLDGLKRAFINPEVRARRSTASVGRVMPKEAVQKIARAKWKPIYCEELQTSFLSQKFAAEALGVLATSVANAVKKKGKVSGKYTLVRVV